MIELRKPHGRGGIGCARSKEYPVKGLKRGESKLKRTPLKHFSAKKRKQMRENKKQLTILLALQHELYGFEFCHLKVGRPDLFKTTCEGAFVVEHVESWRDQEKTNIEKLQVACEKHNLEKGSKNIDGRDAEFIFGLKALK